MAAASVLPVDILRQASRLMQMLVKRVFIIKRKYMISISIVSAIICCVVVYYYLFSLQEISGLYTERSKSIILNLKKDFLKSTVNNLITQINTSQNTKKEYMRSMVANTSAILSLEQGLSDDEFSDFFLDFFKNNEDYVDWTIILWDTKSDTPIYDPSVLRQESWSKTMLVVREKMSSYNLIQRGRYIAVFGVSNEYIDYLVKQSIADTIRNLKFDDNSYVWVNEILNYEGGKNFAVRRVHPSMPLTEGMYLSTDMADSKGNLPYLTELEGIKKNGEIFFSYYFQEPGTSHASEKITYAKLYPDFNWVIAMGIYVNDLNAYIDETAATSNASASRLTAVLALLFVAMLVLSYLLIMLIEKLYVRHTQTQLESELNKDTLTHADSRKYGITCLGREYKAFRKNGASPCIMMFDIDYFKNINDTYGHAVGDIALVEVVDAMYHLIRSSDRLIRWGGDEFIVIFYGLQANNALDFGNKILTEISTLQIEVQQGIIEPTLSLGFSYFKATDSSYKDVVERADQALYLSKKNGRNRATLL